MQLFSIEPSEMKILVDESKQAWKALGEVTYGTDIEKPSRQFRRSLYISKDMKKGDVLTKENLRVIRPGFGLAPKYHETLLGKKINCDTRKGTAMKWDLI